MNPNDPRNSNIIRLPEPKTVTRYRLIGWDNEGGRQRIFEAVSSMALVMSKKMTFERVKANGSLNQHFLFDNYDILIETCTTTSSAVVVEPSEYPDTKNWK